MLENSSYNKMLKLKPRRYFFKLQFQLFIPFYFAHHPLCNDFKKEILAIRTWYICRGCTFVYSSALLTFLITIWINPFANLTIYEGFWFVLGITGPTWLALFHRFQHRWIKDIVRISLGIGWGIAVAELILRPIWLEKIIVLFIIGLIYIVFHTLKHRQAHKHPDHICENCQDINQPSCEGAEQILEAERKFSREYSDYLQQNLRWKDIQPYLVNSEQSFSDK